MRKTSLVFINYMSCFLSFNRVTRLSPTSIRVVMDELEIHQSIVLDVQQMKEYKEELAVARFFSALQSDIASHIRGHVLGSDVAPSLSATFT